MARCLPIYLPSSTSARKVDVMVSAPDEMDRRAGDLPLVNSIDAAAGSLRAPSNAFAAVLLCGGSSRRMGVPKAWLKLGGKPMLLHVLQTLLEVVDEVILVKALGETLPIPIVDTRVRIAEDDLPAAGPLAGIAVGLETLAPAKVGAFVSSCDVPLLSSSWVIAMLASLNPGVDIVLPVALGKEHPLAGVYRRTVAPTARTLLRSGRHRPVFLSESHPTMRIHEDRLRQIDPELASLRNINTPDEYSALVADWEQRHGMEKDRGDC